MTRNAPSNTDDVIDSRDIIARIEELEEERASFRCTEENEDETEHDAKQRAIDWAEENPDDAEELRILAELAEEASGSPDWRHGETLIRASYFKEYAQDLAEDCGMIPDRLAWPLTCIDWEQAARELAMDYFTVDFDGVKYLIRS